MYAASFADRTLSWSLGQCFGSMGLKMDILARTSRLSTTESDDQELERIDRRSPLHYARLRRRPGSGRFRILQDGPWWTDGGSSGAGWLHVWVWSDRRDEERTIEEAKLQIALCCRRPDLRHIMAEDHKGQSRVFSWAFSGSQRHQATWRQVPPR
ncbi:hypothetical protein CPB84DRAFT_1822430 [Gymnopilus junonius]|uniref:Uncharacterized protein n=1 Tax=Gymnopilus junonius TaxID=109634 RepID=A0A9P5NSK2_GYMJU|nr:hypothetical protein CPB84DRAFT_1822430 [Gymnopilus junonius]